MKNARKSVPPPSPSLDASFLAHYNAGIERDRLLKGTSNLEFERTKKILSKYLPRTGAIIVDVGGGPGRYSFWLAAKGHSVHLVDILPLHVQQANRFQKRSKTPLASIHQGDARSLQFEDDSVDALLLFGPLYHLVRRRERLKALSEAHRVLRPRGLLFAAGCSKFTSALDGALNLFIQDPRFMKLLENDLRTGQHRNPTNNPNYFTTAFFHHPTELENEIRQARFRSLKTYAVTGFAWLLPKFDQIWSNRQLKQRLMKILDRTELEPSLLGVSDHLLVVARK